MCVTVKAPASKSMSHRVLIASALSGGESVVRGLLECEDLARTESILRAAGAEISRNDDGARFVRGLPTGLVGAREGAAPVSCDAGESGTTCRILAAVLAAGHGRFRLHGVARLHERPLGALLAALETLGARFTCEEKKGHAPLVIEASGLSGGDVLLPLDESSQYLSGLLLAAPLCRSRLRVSIGGEKVVSWPYVNLTLQTLENFGIRFRVERLREGEWREANWRETHEALAHEWRVTITPGAYRPGDRTVEGDWSGASYLLAAGAVGDAPIRVTGLVADSLQGDREILSLMQRMGARVETDSTGGVTVFPSRLHGIDADMNACPDLVPTLAALAVFATGETCLRGVAHLRLKESDRIAAPAEELRRLGVQVEERADGLRIAGLGRAPKAVGVRFKTHNDHRIAMSLALFGLHGGDVAFDDPSVVCKSFPEFWDVWRWLS